MTVSIPRVETASGISMPAIIYGTAWKKERTAELVVSAATAGFCGFDTACQPKHYYEPGVGEGLKQLYGRGMRREQFYLQTKFTPLSGQDPNTVPYDPLLPLSEQVTQSVAVSQHNLATDIIDTLILHSPLNPFALTVEAWHGMETVVARGTVRQLGISNCYDLKVLKALYETARVKPTVIQNRFYADTGYDRAIREWCGVHGIVYQSFWTLTANSHILGALSIGRLAEKYGCEPAQVFLRFVAQSGIVPLTGTTSVTHMRDDLGMFSFGLTEAEMATIDGLLS